MEERRNKRGFLELLFGIEAFRSFAVKLGMFIVFGLGMNLIENEAVCYAIILCGVVAFLINISMEDCRK